MYYPWHRKRFESLAVRRQTLPHALLFSGATGIGKGAFARALAALILCEQSAAQAACGSCQSCRWLAAEGHPDYWVVAPEVIGSDEEEGEGRDKKKKRDISVAQIRALGDFIHITAHQGGQKVIVIEPADAMNAAAANALLKSLEEPPPATTFLLVSGRPNMLPATIRSRCQKFELSPPTRDEALAWLKTQNVMEPELALAQAGGAPLAAAALADADYWRARRVFIEGLASHDLPAMQLAERVAEIPLPQILAWLQRWTHDLARIAFGQSIRYNPDQAGPLRQHATLAQPLAILRFHRELVRFQRIVNHPLNPRLVLEDLLMRYRQLARA
jgi:DNA polymerase-3 subunit delta'